MSNPDTLMIDSDKYIRVDKVNKLADKVEGMEYCVIRTYSAGVHIGYVQDFGTKAPQQVTLINSRRLHYWDGACSLSQVAMDGVGSGSRIAMALPKITLTDVIEVIPCSEKAAEFFKSAKVWKK